MKDIIVILLVLAYAAIVLPVGVLVIMLLSLLF
jgi:hypothetical protein